MTIMTEGPISLLSDCLRRIFMRNLIAKLAIGTANDQRIDLAQKIVFVMS